MEMKIGRIFTDPITQARLVSFARSEQRWVDQFD